MIELAPHHKRGLTLRTPIMNASGILGFAAEYRSLIDFGRLGAFVTNALTFNPRTPAHPPNAVPLPTGVLIHTGLPNPGLRAALRRHDEEWQRLGTPVIVHLAATALDDVTRSLEYLDQAEGVSGIELGLRDDVSAGEAAHLTRAAVGGPPLVVRLPVLRAEELCDVAAQAGADALTVGAPPRASVQVGKQLVTGRLYSRDNFALALESIKSVASRNLGLPLIGAGGIFGVGSARAMFEAGVQAIQVDAAAWTDPAILDQLQLEFAPTPNSNSPL